MHNLRQILLGFFIAMVSLSIVLGGLSLSFAEQGITSQATMLSSTNTDSPIHELTITMTQPSSPTPIVIISASSTNTATRSATPTACQPPDAWIPYTLQDGDTLEILASHYGSNVEDLVQANCLATTIPAPGSVIYVPVIPTRTSVMCGPPSGWISYKIKSGDTLYHLSQVYGVTVQQIQNANCMGSSIFLRAGQSLYVPPWATRTPSQISLPTLTPTYSPTSTTSLTPTGTVTMTFTPTETSTASPTEAYILTPTDTITQTSTQGTP